MSTNSSPPSSITHRRISDVISSLRTAFREADFKEAEREFRAWEDKWKREKTTTETNWREKLDIVESDRNELKLKVDELEEERRRLIRECQVNNDKVTDLARELSLMKERVEKTSKRFDQVNGDIRVMEKEKDELLGKLLDAHDEMDVLKRCLREKDMEMKELVDKHEEVLGEQMDIKREKDEQIKELINSVECLRKEKRELLEEIEVLQKVENRVRKLESEVARCTGAASGVTCNEGVASPINEPNCCPVPEIKLEEIVKRTSVFGTEVSSERGATCIKDAASSGGVVIVLSDSDNDNEPPFLANVLKRKRAFSERSSQKDFVDGSSDDFQIPDHRIKKLIDRSPKVVKPEPPLSTSSRSCNKFVTTQSETVAIVRKCSEMLDGNVKEPHRLLGDDNSPHNGRGTQADTFCSPQAHELIATCRRSRAK